jgi:hypothetical protein
MARVHKCIVTDEDGRPLAVQIDYADWIAIESELTASGISMAKSTNLAKHSGVLTHRFDALEYQNSIRSEWR